MGYRKHPETQNLLDKTGGGVETEEGGGGERERERDREGGRKRGFYFTHSVRVTCFIHLTATTAFSLEHKGIEMQAAAEK